MAHCVRKQIIVALAIVAGAAHVRADDAAPLARQQQLERERAAIEARYRQQQADCAVRFTVTACTDEAKAQRRRALEPLERERSALEDQERRRRAAERLQRIDEKRRDAAQRQPPALQLPASPRITQLPDAPPRAGRASQARQASQPRVPRPGAAAAYERRQREAEAHRADVKQRNEARPRQPAAPLPDPPPAAGF